MGYKVKMVGDNVIIEGDGPLSLSLGNQILERTDPTLRQKDLTSLIEIVEGTQELIKFQQDEKIENLSRSIDKICKAVVRLQTVVHGEAEKIPTLGDR